MPVSFAPDPLPDVVSQLLENACRPGGERVRKPLLGIRERTPQMDRLDAGHLVLFEKLYHAVRALAHTRIVRRIGGTVDDDRSEFSFERLSVAPQGIRSVEQDDAQSRRHSEAGGSGHQNYVRLFHE